MNYRNKYIVIGIIIGLLIGLLTHHFTNGCEHSFKTIDVNNQRKFSDAPTKLYINNEYFYDIYILDKEGNQMDYGKIELSKID